METNVAGWQLFNKYNKNKTDFITYEIENEGNGLRTSKI
jgi:hypothetical protein